MVKISKVAKVRTGCGDHLVYENKESRVRTKGEGGKGKEDCEDEEMEKDKLCSLIFIILRRLGGRLLPYVRFLCWEVCVYCSCDFILAETGLPLSLITLSRRTKDRVTELIADKRLITECSFADRLARKTPGTLPYPMVRVDKQ